MIQAFLRQDPDGYQGVVVGVLIDIFNLEHLTKNFILCKLPHCWDCQSVSLFTESMCETAIAAQANPHMMRLDWINRRYLSICLSNMEHAFL